MKIIKYLCICFLLIGCVKYEEPVAVSAPSSIPTASILPTPTPASTVDTSKPNAIQPYNAAYATPVDLDLIFMSSTAIYSEVYNMVNSPKEYVGKKVRLLGNFTVGQDQNGNQVFACIIPDATKCCAQGVQFFWEGTHTYPDDYPADGEIIVVEGIFNYEEGYINTIMLENASAWVLRPDEI
ncbi:MAG: hypothetical protein IKE51_06170 [Solobacterium sp.]|nr:hypothetical protein [Solobacterium sp.]